MSSIQHGPVARVSDATKRPNHFRLLILSDDCDSSHGSWQIDPFARDELACLTTGVFLARCPIQWHALAGHFE